MKYISRKSKNLKNTHISIYVSLFKRTAIFLLFFTIINFIIPLSLFANKTNSFVNNNYSRASMDSKGNIYIRENLHEKIHPASLTKIAISIVAIERLNLQNKVLIEEINYNLPEDYVTTPLFIGETLTVEDLLYATMLKSGNDAAIYLAKEVFGNNDNFTKEINNYLKDLGLLNTHFTNPFGLEDDNHYTTAYDLLILSKYAMQNDTFKKIVSLNEYIIPRNNYSDERVIKTTSLFANPNSSVFNEDFYGIKSGYTEKAGDCYIAASEILDQEFYFIYTGASSRLSKFEKIQNMFNDTKYVLEHKLFLDQNSIEYINKQYEQNNKLVFNTIYTKFFFSTFDKIIFVLFLLILLVFILKLVFSKSRKSRRVNKKVGTNKKR